MFRTLSSKQMMDVQGLRFLLEILVHDARILMKYAKANISVYKQDKEKYPKRFSEIKQFLFFVYEAEAAMQHKAVWRLTIYRILDSPHTVKQVNGYKCNHKYLVAVGMDEHLSKERAREPVSVNFLARKCKICTKKTFSSILY